MPEISAVFTTGTVPALATSRRGPMGRIDESTIVKPGETPVNLLKIFALGATSLVGVALAAAMPPAPASPPDEPPPPKSKKKDDRGSGGELKKAYDLLRRIRSDNRASGRPEERLRDWTDRATKLYREGLKSFEKRDDREAREYGLAAHDLARAVDHARNAASFDLDDDLPPPPDRGGPGDEDERTRRDLRHAYDRIGEIKDAKGVADLPFYLDASKDLYNAARRDATSGRGERAGELARAAEALTHVPEHLARAAGEGRPEPKEKRERPEPKEKRERPEPPKAKHDRPEPKEKGERPEPKEKRERDDLPPPIE